MKTPNFWYESPGVTSSILLPISYIYLMGSKIKRKLANPKKVDPIVISVGNLVAGGAGKTPIAIALSSLFFDKEVAFLTRGYGGNDIGPTLVDRSKDIVDKVGDEALLLAKHAPTWVSKDRHAGAIAAYNYGINIIIMDDGHQNNSLIKDISIVVIDGHHGFGNKKIIPSGPLRENIKTGLDHADAVIIIGEDKNKVSQFCKPNCPLIHARLVPTMDSESLKKNRVIALAGIGYPYKFFNTLKEMGCNVVDEYAFGDHHKYKNSEIRKIYDKSVELNAILVTTEKDWLRLPEEMKTLVKKVPIKIEWQDEKQIKNFLKLITTK